MSAQIYTALIEQCECLTLGDRWPFVRAEQDSRLMPSDGAEVLESLTTQFDVEDLLEAGIVVQTDDQTGLNPKLTGEDRTLIVLRNVQQQPFDIVTSTGTLLDHAPVLASLDDTPTLNVLGAAQRQLFVAATIQDTAVLRSLGLPAAVATYMDRLPDRLLQKLLAMADDYTSCCDISIHIVLIGCDLTAGTYGLPPNIAAVASNLAQAKRFLEMPGLAISVWWPSVDEINNLEMRRRACSVKLVREFFQRGTTLRDVEEFADPSKPPSREPTYAGALEDFLAAEAQCREHPNSERDSEKAREALDTYVQQVDRVISGPLFDSAVRLPDLSRRSLRLQLAHASRVLHRMMPRVHDAQARSLEGYGRDPIDFMSDGSWKRFQMMMDMVIRLVREEARLRKNNSTS